MSSCHCFQQMHLEPNPQEPIARETFLNFQQNETMKIAYMKGSTWANSTPASLAVWVVRFGKALFNCCMDRNSCHVTLSHRQHGCREAELQKACPIKVCSMASLFVGLMNHHKSVHPCKAATCRTQGVAHNGLSF